MDRSEIKSLSGRSAMLGDGFSRNLKDRDSLLAARTKDLEGLTGQLRGFDLDQYLGKGTEGEGPVPGEVGEDAIPDPPKPAIEVPVAVALQRPGGAGLTPRCRKSARRFFARFRGSVLQFGGLGVPSRTMKVLPRTLTVP